MKAFEDSTAGIDEPRSARLSMRAQPPVKDAIVRAAALGGVGAGSFAVSAAYVAARQAIEAHREPRTEPGACTRTVLKSEADCAVFFAALENPPKPNKRLREAFALRRKMIANPD